MIRRVLAYALGVSLLFTAGASVASPESDLKAFRAYFKKKFPDVPMDDYVNGVYALDKGARTEWEQIEEFPPYELPMSEGETMFNTPFKNGKTYADCFPNGGKGIKQNYPYFDSARGEVVTLELSINECREKNGEKPLGYQKGKIAAISAYMAYTSRGNTINVKVPDDPRAMAAYEDGKRFFYSKRGQLNFSCSNCHLDAAGMKIRADRLSPALGHVTHFPVYRSKWGSMGTIHRRYGGCNRQVRAKSFKPQGKEYRNLEYFHTYMSNGLVINGPGARK